MKFVIASALGVLFTLIACYAENLPVFSYGTPLFVLVYGGVSFALVCSVGIRSIKDVLKGVVSFLLVAAVFRGLLVIYSLSGQSLEVDGLIAILFWIIVSGLVTERFIKKVA